MNRLVKIALPLTMAVLLAGCFDGSSGSSSNNDGEPTNPDPGPGPNPAVDFSRFVIAEIDNTDDTREPVDINNQEFNFNDQNNEQAFDELFIP